MIFESVSTVIDLVRDFYMNINYERGDGYFMTWLCGHYIQVDPKLSTAIPHTPQVLDPAQGTTYLPASNSWSASPRDDPTP